MEIDRESHAIASAIVRDIDGTAVYGTESVRHLDERSAPVVISDLQADFVDFYADVRLFGDAGLHGVPVRRVAGLTVPMAASALLGQSAALAERNRALALAEGDGWPDDGGAADMPITDRLREAAYGGGQDTELRSVDEARYGMVELASTSLAIRLAAERGRLREEGAAVPLFAFSRIGGPRVPVAGCLFQVTANSPALRVYWSPAYRISGNYFGYPTSPVTAPLPAGAYVFGSDDAAGSPITWDTAAIVTLPGPAVSLHLAQ